MSESTNRKQMVMEIFHREYGKNAYKLMPQLVCNICGMKVFGKGSLLRDSEWVDVCRCTDAEVRGVDSKFSMLPEGVCLVWGENPLQ